MKLRVKHKMLIIFLLNMNAICAYTQKSMDYSQYMFNNLLENPAYAGRSEIPNFIFLTRHQWIDVDGAPSAYVLSLHTPLKNKNTGIGMDMKINSIGPLQVTGLFMNYSYTLKISESASLSMGIQGGGNFYEVNLRQLTIINPNDPLFQKDIENIFLPNFGTGFHLKLSKYYFDLSVPMLMKNKLIPAGVDKQGTFSRENRIYIFGGGTSISISKDIDLLPSMLGRFVNGVPANIDITAAAILKGIFGVGISYRMGSSFSGLLNYQLSNGLKIGYAYDSASGAFGGFISGTHELMIGYDFEFTKQKTMSPRRF